MSCPARVRAALEPLPGVKGVQIDFERKEASVSLEEGKITGAQVLQALEKAGFPGSRQLTQNTSQNAPTPANVSIRVAGMVKAQGIT